MHVRWRNQVAMLVWEKYIYINIKLQIAYVLLSSPDATYYKLTIAENYMNRYESH